LIGDTSVADTLSRHHNFCSNVVADPASVNPDQGQVFFVLLKLKTFTFGGKIYFLGLKTAIFFKKIFAKEVEALSHFLYWDHLFPHLNPGPN
jgi:hypothetical protein